MKCKEIHMDLSRAAVRPTRKKVFIPVRANIMCLGERHAHPPNSENPVPRAEIAGRMGLCVLSPQMAWEWGRPFMSTVNMSPTAGVLVYHGEEMTFFTPNLI